MDTRHSSALSATSATAVPSLRTGRYLPPPGSAPPVLRGTMPARPWRGVAASLRSALLPLPRPATDAPRQADVRQEAPASWERAAARRRFSLLLLVLLSAAGAATLLLHAQPVLNQPVWRVVQVALFSLLFAWIAAGFFTALMGFFVQWRGDRHALSAAAVAHHRLHADARTAVVMPICNEHVPTVFAGLRATAESLAATGGAKLFDIFVLSDTADPALRASEEAAWAALRDELARLPGASGLKLYYRWRQRRTRRKAGNVADFCRRWGRLYRYMVVLDADSVMTGDALTSLVRLMEAHPKAGIIQTAPVSCGVRTLHARGQQFAGRVVGRLFTAGMQYWQLGESHYWGHNAILRTEPFMRHCGLAALPGDGGLGGHILSHDFVEAALMRRAGYEVWLVNDLEGSYEQQPPNLVEELLRDRRWCQGNLQNARLITEPGLRPVHRAMLATGAMAYLSAPLWLGFVLMGAALWLTGGYTLFPTQVGWPIELLGLWGLTLTMLSLPRLLGVAAICLRGDQARHGGAGALLGGALLEGALSALQAPVRMVAHTVFVLVALTGLKLDWKSPPREAQAIGWRDAGRRFGAVSAIVAIGLGFGLWTDPAAAAWLLPVGGPLLLAVPLAVWTSRTVTGDAVRRWGLLQIPEERSAPGVLRRAWALATAPCIVSPRPSRPRSCDTPRPASTKSHAAAL